MRLPPSDGFASAIRRSGIGAHPLEWRVPPIETYPAVIAFARTYAGKVLLFAAFAALMRLLADMWLEVTIAAAVVSLAGRYRHYAALACTAALLVRDPYWFGSLALDEAMLRQEGLSAVIHPEYLRIGTLAVCIPLTAMAIHLTRRFRDHRLGRRPVLAEHMLCFCLLGLVASHLLQGVTQVLLWSMTATFTAYFWFLAYALLDQRRRHPEPIFFHFATFHPFFGATTVIPMGKDAANWRSVEAATAEDLAVTQLKAFKLLAWAFFLKAVRWVFHRIVYDTLGITPLWLAFDKFLEGENEPVSFGFLSIVANFPDQLLSIAIWGHVIIAAGRLAGFRLLRNTYRPLSSRTVAEFWNRYFYYFKEMLVHIYFYPTYVRCFKRHPRLRIAFATFMAAGVGNFLFHCVLDNKVVELGLVEAVIRSQTYAFYCAVLVAGIVISQLRARPPDASAGWIRRRFLPSLGVFAFYCFLSFFDGPIRHVALSQHFKFLFEVLGGNRWIQAIG